MAQGSTDTLDYIIHKYNLDINKRRMPIEIPNVGRKDLARLFAELGFKVGAEIGVAFGQYSEILCQSNPSLTLYCIDPWKMYSDYADFNQPCLDEHYETAKKRLAPYDCRFIKKFSMDALGDIEDEELDFVYIDANHNFLHVTEDVYWWTKKVRPDGIVSGHDYIKMKGKSLSSHVTMVLPAYTRAFRIRPWFVLGLRGKYSGMTRDTSRSWMWVK